MDEDYRERARGLEAADPEAVVAALTARLRAGERAQVHASHDVGGPLLGAVLRYLIESSGQREVEVLRAHAVEPKHQARWVIALRDLMSGERHRSWTWVERWAGLLGFDLELLALAADCRGPSQGGSHAWELPLLCCRRCEHLRLDLTEARRSRRSYCGEPGRAGEGLEARRIAAPTQHSCPAFLARRRPDP
ncbi:MAG: hypothetical protein AB7N76_24970 [Planctomycetota bacterium]